MEAIGNELKRFIKVNELSLKSPDKRIGKILVEVDIHSGLLESLEIVWRGRTVSQPLVYLGIAFRCNFCCRTGHLRRDCKGSVEEEESDDSLLTKATREDSPEVDSFELATQHSAQEEISLVESLDSFPSKLKTFSPHFFFH
jgi:hypothetical protein